MSILVEDPSAPLIAGAIMVRETDAIGIRGDALPNGGVGFESYLFACADLPADNAVEFRGEVLSHSFPAGLFEYYDDGSTRVNIGCPDGTYTYTFRLLADGVAQTPLITNTVIVGASGAFTIATNLDAFTSDLQLVVPAAAQLTINGSLDVFAANVVLGTSASMTINAGIDSFVSVVSLLGELAGNLPSVLSPSRQYTVNPDVHLDAYAIQNQFVLLWEKDPDATLDYSLNWADWLAEVPGDSIANMYVNTSSGVQVPAQGIVGGSVTGVLVRSGAVGTIEEITIRISTTQGRIDERTIKLLIRQR